MSMTNPTILQLLEKADCRYTLVVEVSKRARQLVDGIPPLIDAKDKENMPVSIAIDEDNRGRISYERTAENDPRQPENQKMRCPRRDRGHRCI